MTYYFDCFFTDAFPKNDDGYFRRIYAQKDDLFIKIHLKNLKTYWIDPILGVFASVIILNKFK